MKIAIVAPSPVPFTIGGAEILLQEMQYAIKKYSSHQCELIKLPVKEDNFWNLVDSYCYFFHLDLSHFDMVISTKYPSWMVQHPNHRVYLIHHLRGLFDTYDSCQEPDKIPDVLRVGLVHEIASIAEQENPTMHNVNELFEKIFLLKKNQKQYAEVTFKFPGPFIKEIIHFLDRFALSPGRIQRYFTMSENVRRRKNYFPPNVNIKVIYPPSSLEFNQCHEYQHLLTVSRLDGPKRIDLLIKSMKYVPHNITLKIVGEGPEESKLKKLAERDKKIEFLGFVSEKRLEELYAKALVVLFVPYDEDYGLITIEGMMSGKPVISAIDSGGPLEFISNGENGYIVDPDPQKIAEKINYFIENKKEAIRMGNMAYERVKSVTWEKFTADLLCDTSKISSCRKKILILSTYSCFPPRGGGQQRLYNLYSRLALDYDITICSVIESNKEYQNLILSNGLKQICVPQSLEQARIQRDLEKHTGMNLYDISMIDTIEKSDVFLQKIKKLFHESDIIVFAHPYLFDLVKYAGEKKRIIYDAIDTEYLQKKRFIKNEKLLEKIFDIEQRACRESELIWTTSQEEKCNFINLYHVSPNKLFVIPNGTDPSFIKFIDRNEKNQAKQLTGFSEYQTVLFVGSWHPPNLEALTYITEKLAKKLKKVKFLIVGSVKDYYLQQKPAFPDNVLAFGVVDEVEKFELYKLADLAISPIFSGSGTNLKILDYMSAGIPVISTPIGARGLEIVNNINAVICESHQFANEIENLLNNEKLQDIIRCNARKIIEERYSWDIIAQIASRSLEIPD